jgi:hypothetical protein
VKLVRKKLDNNREKKLSLDYRVVEKITTEFLERWNIDNEVETWLQQKLELSIDWNQVTKNLKAGKKKYIPQFGGDLFLELKEKVQERLDRYKQDEIAFLKRNVGDLEAKHFEEIFVNVMDPIPLTSYTGFLSLYAKGC